MRGFPRFFETRQDFLNCIQEWPDETRAELRSLWQDRFSWGDERELEDGEEGVEDGTHRVVARPSPDGDGVARVQQELAVDSRARVYRMGFTDAEVRRLLKG